MIFLNDFCKVIHATIRSFLWNSEQNIKLINVTTLTVLSQRYFILLKGNE